MSKSYHQEVVYPFEHEVSGVPYEITAEVLYTLKESNPDYFEDFIVEEILITDTFGNDFSDTIIIEDSILRKQLFVQKEITFVTDFSGLSIKHFEKGEEL